MAEALAGPAGWHESARGDGWVRAEHASLPITLAVQVRRVEGECDPRGVAARLAAAVSSAVKSSVEVEFRSWGAFARREVALQVLRAGARSVFHAVWLDGPLCVVLAATSEHPVSRDVGAAFADAVGALSARTLS